jgi:hypothetical protein
VLGQGGHRPEEQEGVGASVDMVAPAGMDDHGAGARPVGLAGGRRAGLCNVALCTVKKDRRARRPSARCRSQAGAGPCAANHSATRSASRALRRTGVTGAPTPPQAPCDDRAA